MRLELFDSQKQCRKNDSEMFGGSIKPKFHECFGYFIVVIIVFLVFSAQIGTVFDLKDDHRIVAFSGAVQLPDQLPEPEASWPEALLNAVVVDANHTGRVRPITQLAEVGLPRILGLDPEIWRILWVFVALVAASLVYVLGLRLFRHWGAALVVTLIVMLSPDPGPTAVWYKLGAKAEVIGVLFILVAVLLHSCASRSRNKSVDVLALSAIVMAGLTKESFILLLPAVLALRMWMEAEVSGLSFIECIQRVRWLVPAYASIAGVLLALVAWVVLSAGLDSYGGRSATASLKDLFHNLVVSLEQSPRRSAWFIPAIAAVLLAFHSRGPGTFQRSWSYAISIGAIWVVPQFFLYSSRGGMWDHYWMPCVVGLAGVNGAATTYVVKSGNVVVRWLLCAVFGLWVVDSVRIDVMAITNFKERSAVQQGVVSDIAASLPDGGNVVVVADMQTQSELAYSLLYFIAERGVFDFAAYLYDTTVTTVAENKNKGGFTASFFFPKAPSFSDLNAQCIDAIIYLDHPRDDDVDWQRWQEAGQFVQESRQRPQIHYSLKKFARVEQSFTLSFALRDNRAVDNPCE